MKLFLACCCGLIVALMNVFNSQLTNRYGIHWGTFMVHLVGLLTFILIIIIKRKKIKLTFKIPLWLYLGGVIGILTVVFNGISIVQIGSTLVTALSLIGQIVIGIILELTGFLQTRKQSLSIQKIAGLIVIIIGVGVMLQ